MLREEFAELKEQLRRRGNKRNFQDIIGWGSSTIGKCSSSIWSTTQETKGGATRWGKPSGSPSLGNPIYEDSSNSLSNSSSTSSITEPEMAGRSDNPEEAPPPAQEAIQILLEHLEEAVRLVQRNEELDGTRRRADGDRGLYEPTRKYLQRWVS